MPPRADLTTLLGKREPRLNAGTCVFALLSATPLDATVIALARKGEGVSVVRGEPRASALGLQPALRCAWITLAVHSDLQTVGLTGIRTRASA